MSAGHDGLKTTLASCCWLPVSTVPAFDFEILSFCFISYYAFHYKDS